MSALSGAVHMRVAAVIAAFGVVCFADPLIGQAPAPTASGTASITGRAIDGVTRAPLAGTSVSLGRNTQDGVRVPGRTIITDAQGRFAFSGLPEGRYALTAIRPGWTQGVYGVEQPRAQDDAMPYNLALQGGQRVSVDVPVWRDAVLSGRVTTETGEPVGNARVSASQWTVSMGRRTLSGSLTLADDRGVFSIRVRPGDYLISALSDDGRARGVGTTPGTRLALATTFFPASPDATGAAVISVTSGDERSALDIRMPLVPARRITGRVHSIDGAVVPNRITLTSDDNTGFQRAAAVGIGGGFVFDYVPSGRYIIATPGTGVVVTGRGGGANGAVGASWVRASVEVSNTDLDVSVPVRRSLRVSGRVQFDGAGTPPSASITLTRDTEGAGSDIIPASFPVDSDGRFTVDVTPGRFIVSASGGQAPFNLNAPRLDAAAVAARSWTQQSAMSGGRDVSSTALTVTADVSDVVVTLTERGAELRGRVLTAQNLDDISVLLFPSDESLWVDFGIGRRMRSVRPGTDGTFAVASLPAGDYYVCAVRGVSQRAWRTGAIFDVLAPLATRIALDPGVVASRDLQVVPAPAPRAAQLKPPALALQAGDVADVRPAEAAPPNGGGIAGRVIDAVTKAPIAGMQLSLSRNLEGAVYSDDNGRFLLTDVGPGVRMVYSQKPGYVPATDGARQSDDPGIPVTVAAGQPVTDVTLPIMRGASITATVVDQYGQPMPEVEISARQYRWQPQGRELITPRTPGRIGPLVTDTNGSFRIYGLAPGDYVLEARPRGNAAYAAVTVTSQADLDAAAGRLSAVPAPATAMYPTLIYPTQADIARGARLRLAAGEERTVSLQMDLVQSATVRGAIRGPDGRPVTRTVVELLPSDPATAAATPPLRQGMAGDDGRFTIPGVVPGRYTLVPRPLQIAEQPSTSLSGALDIIVTGDVDGVVLDLSSAPSLSGRVRSRAGTMPVLPNVRVQVTRIGVPVTTTRPSPTAPLDSDGRFSFSNLPTGRYRLTLVESRRAQTPVIVSQTVNGEEMLHAGIAVAPGAPASVDLIVASGPLQVSGRLRQANSQPANELLLILFAREAEAWASPAVRVFATRPDQNSRFTFHDVPPGNYWIASVKVVEPNGWFDPELLKTLAAGAQAVSIVDGNSPELVVTIP